MISVDIEKVLVDLDDLRQQVLEGPIIKYRGDHPILAKWILGREIFGGRQSEHAYASL